MPKLRLTRQQLASFLKDHESIRQFESLFSEIENVSSNQEYNYLDARSALAKSQLAADLVEDLSHRVSNRILSKIQYQNNSVVTDYIDLPIIGPHVTQERRIQWNTDDGTVDVGLFNGVVLQVGQETHYYAKNTSGVVIPDGASVMCTGTVGASSKLTIAKAVADGSIAGDYMLGVATQEIADNAFGYVTAFGIVRGIDTSGTPYGEVWADGDVLYFHPTTAGGLTKVAPSAPNLRSRMAIVLYASAGGSGSILVRAKTGELLTGLNDVYAPSPSNYDILQWNTTNSRFEKTGIAVGLKYGGTATNYSFFEADGTLVFNGAATVWKDIDFPIIIRTTGANIPTLATLQGNVTAPQWAVNDYNVCEGQELIHEWKEGSQAQFHVHMITNGLDATDRYVNWEVEYCSVGVNGVLSAVTVVSNEILIPANTTSKTMILGQVTLVTFALTIGAHVFARLRRIAVATPGRSEPTNNPWCSMLQLHVECDTTGSRSMSAK